MDLGLQEVTSNILLVRGINVPLVTGRGQDKDDDVAKFRIQAEFLQELVAIHARHVEVEHDNGVGTCVGVGPQHRERLGAVAGDLQFDFERLFTKRASKRFDIEFVVFNKQE